MTGRVYVRTRDGFSWGPSRFRSKVGHSARDLKKPVPHEEQLGCGRTWYTNFPTSDFLAVEAAAHELLANFRVGRVKEFYCEHEQAVAAVQKAMKMVADGWRPPAKMTEEELLQELERRMM